MCVCVCMRVCVCVCARGGGVYMFVLPIVAPLGGIRNSSRALCEDDRRLIYTFDYVQVTLTTIALCEDDRRRTSNTYRVKL